MDNATRRLSSKVFLLAAVFLPLALCVASVHCAPITVSPDRPNSIAFPEQETKFVRFAITASSGGQPCLDELEVYGPEGEKNLALAKEGAKAAASSCLPGHSIHRIEHLNDGVYGNSNSWIAAGVANEWAQIELPKPTVVNRIVFSRDRNGVFKDRIATAFEIRLSLDGEEWTTIKEVVSKVARVEGPGALPAPPPAPVVEDDSPDDDLLRYAFLGEEHAWLKTYGRADISPELVPYNGRVKEYPRHRGDDTLPLPPLTERPALDGNLGDPCWKGASRGVARVAFPDKFAQNPCVEHTLSAGRYGDDLYLALEMDRLLSSHLAVVSTEDWRGIGVIALTEEGLAFNRYGGKGDLAESVPLEGAFNEILKTLEVLLPLKWFPDWEEQGFRVGLGMGGRHTRNEGRAVHLVFSELAVAELTPTDDATFRVSLGLPETGASKEGRLEIVVHGNTPELEKGVHLSPGESQTLVIQANSGKIGPEFDLKIGEGNGRSHKLHLFRYDPVVRTLDLMEEMADRFEGKGLDVSEERRECAELRAKDAKINRKLRPDRQLFSEARLAKRRLFFRENDLAPIENILFVKRRPFLPSHNYSVILDAPFRPGGGICLVSIPRHDDRWEPSEAKVTTLFDAGEGISRTPMADFDLNKIYFGHRPSEKGYYHIMSMNPDGSDPVQMTDGPFHDYWPCPLPDGDLAFITTRCKAKFLCWRPQAAVLFRMKPDGSEIRPLSHANLTEWAPSVMADGRIIWTRSEYLDKGADFGHTLWGIRPDGTRPELIFGNDIIQPNGYANGREVPGSNEFSCTLISHFGDLNGPIALVDTGQGPSNPEGIRSLTPEVPWPGAPPKEECFRDPFPIATDYFLCSHAPRDRFGLYVIDRYGNREQVYADPEISSMCPTPFSPVQKPPVLVDSATGEAAYGEFFLADVYQGIEHAVERGRVKYLRVCEEVKDSLDLLPSGEYRSDHEPFMNRYVSPVDLVNGPSGWPTYVAKASLGVVPVEEDGSAHFYAPAGKVLYFEILDEDFNELQRMRSVVQLQPGERRSCVGCHEHRRMAPPNTHAFLASGPRHLDAPSWGPRPFSFEEVVQPVLDNRCVECHNPKETNGVDLSGTHDEHAIPSSYRNLVAQGWVNYCDYGWNSGGCEKKEPLTFGTVKSKLWDVLDAGHHEVQLSTDEMRRIKTWIDLNCPLWPDYKDRDDRPKILEKVSKADLKD